MAQQWHVAYTTELHKAKRNRRKRDGVLYVFGSRLELHHVNEDGSREGEPVVRSLATERIEEGAIISLEECEIEIAERIDCGRDFPLQSSNAQRLPNNRLQQPRQREQQPLRDNTNKDFMDDIWAELEGGKGGASEPGARHKPTSYSYQQRTKGVIWPSNTLQRSEWCGPSLCGAFSDEAVNGEQGRRVEIKAQFRDGKEYLEVLEQAIIEETRLKMVHGVKEIRESLSQLGEQHQLPASTFGSRLSLYSRSYLERRGSKLWLQVRAQPSWIDSFLFMVVFILHGCPSTRLRKGCEKMRAGNLAKEIFGRSPLRQTSPITLSSFSRAAPMASRVTIWKCHLLRPLRERKGTASIARATPCFSDRLRLNS